jgi:hypothetical protein
MCPLFKLMALMCYLALPYYKLPMAREKLVMWDKHASTVAIQSVINRACTMPGMGQLYYIVSPFSLKFQL